MESIFVQLAIILGTAFIVSYVVKTFKQPIIIGYIIAGMVIASFIGFGVLDMNSSQETIKLFSEFGIAFLLFIVGLHLNPRVIKEIGASSLIIGLAQMILTFVFGFAAGNFLGYNLIASSYIGIALAFSSTIITMKLLSDERKLESLASKISIGILIIQDLVAIFVLMFITSSSNFASLNTFMIKSVLLGGVLILVLFLFGFFVLPKAIKSIAKSQELLFLFSLCWCFLISALFFWIGMSIEIGALIAGMILSISPYSIEISSKIRPLRDFFIIIFFIILGLNIPMSNLGSVIGASIIISLIVLIIKPIILMTLTALTGYTKRTNFIVGTTLAQISEFSVIILMLGFSLGHVEQNLVHIIALTLIITTIFSTYFIILSEQLYKKLSGFASLFEKGEIKRERKTKRNCNAILFGYNRIGFGILNSMKKIKKNYLVVDFNPDTIADLTKLRIPCLYGDVEDQDLLEELPLDKIELAVSTIPDLETNLLLVDTIRNVNADAIIIVRAHQIKDALDLYRRGASYVLTPHFLGGEYIAKMIEEVKTDKSKYEKEKEKHIQNLIKRFEKGHEHPDVEKG